MHSTSYVTVHLQIAILWCNGPAKLHDDYSKPSIPEPRHNSILPKMMISLGAWTSGHWSHCICSNGIYYEMIKAKPYSIRRGYIVMANEFFFCLVITAMKYWFPFKCSLLIPPFICIQSFHSNKTPMAFNEPITFSYVTKYQCSALPGVSIYTNRP